MFQAALHVQTVALEIVGGAMLTQTPFVFQSVEQEMGVNVSTLIMR